LKGGDASDWSALPVGFRRTLVWLKVPLGPHPGSGLEFQTDPRVVEGVARYGQ